MSNLVGLDGKPMDHSSNNPKQIIIFGVQINTETGHIGVWSNRDLINRMSRSDKQATIDAIRKIAEKDFDCIMRGCHAE